MGKNDAKQRNYIDFEFEKDFNCRSFSISEEKYDY